MKLRLVAGAVIGLGLALVAPATAQPKPTDVNAAKEHYKAAQAAEASGDFAGAALEYGIAYDLTKDPILFFKIGNANEKAGKCAVALTYYQRYLKEGAPSDEYKRLTEERIAGCKAATGQPPAPGTSPVSPRPGLSTTAPPTGGVAPGPTGDAPTAPAPTTPAATAGGEAATGDAPVTTPDDSPVAGDGADAPAFTDQGASWKRSAAWVSTAATIGLAAVGTVLYMSAEGSEEDLQALADFRDQNGRPLAYDEVRTQYEDLVDEGERFDRLSTVAFAAAGATAALAITFFVLDAQSGGREPPAAFMGRVTPRVDRHGAAVSMGWEF